MKFFLTDHTERATWFGCLALATLLATMCVAVSLFAQGVVHVARTQLLSLGVIDDASVNNVFLMTSLATTLIMTVIFFALLLQMRGPDPTRKEDRRREKERHEHAPGERRRERDAVC